MLADPHRAGEGDKIGVRIGDHRITHGLRIARHHRQHLRRQALLHKARRRARARSAASVRSASAPPRLLVAIAGAILWLTMLSGWLNGVIAEMAPSSGGARREDLARLALQG